MASRAGEFAVLLRGVNVGGTRRVPMARRKPMYSGSALRCARITTRNLATTLKLLTLAQAERPA